MPKKTKKQPQNVNGKKDYDRLLAMARENPWCVFNVNEIRVLFGIPEHQLTRLRKLAARDPETDPWLNDKTRPEKFHDWLWSKRFELEKTHRDV